MLAGGEFSFLHINTSFHNIVCIIIYFIFRDLQFSVTQLYCELEIFILTVDVASFQLFLYSLGQYSSIFHTAVRMALLLTLCPWYKSEFTERNEKFVTMYHLYHSKLLLYIKKSQF